MAIKTLIADDHILFLAGLRALFGTQSSVEVIGEVTNGKDAIRRAGEIKPDLVVLDLSMPQYNGTEAIGHIKKKNPKIKVLVLTAHKTDEYIHAALNAGADGYILKDDSQEELMIAIQRITANKTYLSPNICANVVRGYLDESNRKDFTPSWEMLSRRERQILKLIAEGYRNKDMAAYLSISLKTVEKHRSNLMKKLDLHRTSSLTAYAIEHGLVTN